MAPARFDTNFGSGGIVALPIGSSPGNRERHWPCRRTKKILIAGSARFANDDNVAVARWLIDDCGNGLVDAGDSATAALIDGIATAARAHCPAAFRVPPLADACDNPPTSAAAPAPRAPAATARRRRR